MANTPQIARHLESFDFTGLFIELGWLNPTDRLPHPVNVDGELYSRTQIAQLSGVVVFEVTGPDGRIPDRASRKRIHAAISKLVHENILIFVDHDRNQSLWLWVKREKGKSEVREHDYFRGQPVDLMLSKLVRINFEIEDFDDSGNPPPIIEVARRLQKSLDIEKVTKKFFIEFQAEHIGFLDHIHGIDNERDRRWYASVILNRLMFIYFLQKKFFVAGDQDYLQRKLRDTRERGEARYYDGFLRTLFFVGFAKPEADRNENERSMLGDVPYLNGGLFLPHKLENEYDIQIDDEAFDNVFQLFEHYSWNLDDTPGGNPDEISPDVLGYIFEKYINQKAFGAYYTRPEITQYLCEQTIYKLILERVGNIETANPSQRTKFESMPDLLINLDAFLCGKLWFEILPSLKILDPACGSGAFLVAALKTLMNVYSAVIGKMETLGDQRLKDELDKIRSEHKSINYDIKKRIITDNLYGVDMMEEAAEIAKLRLFMTLVSSVHHKNELEPLPNIDFNILAGNSLIGILKVDSERFDRIGESVQPSLLASESAEGYRQILVDKNRSIELYKNHTFKSGEDEAGDQNTRLLLLREHIEKTRSDSYMKLNELLLGDFRDLKIKFEQPTWDEKKGKEGKSVKRDLQIEDIRSLHPFHWGYEFDEILNERGGFDAIITNPPWEIFKPNSKEFFAEYSDLVMKNKMSIKEFESKKNELLKAGEIKAAWLDYLGRFPYVSLYYRSSDQYKNQISTVNGKKAGTDINLYKLFLEQCFNLLRKTGRCGIIVQSGIYTDLGTKQLREMLFTESSLETLYGFSNEKFIFENVHHAQKFCLLIFEKGGPTECFEAAFRINPREAVGREDLERFLNSPSEHIIISVDLVRKLSPDSSSITEFKNSMEIEIAKKTLRHPLLSETIENSWNLKLTAEFHMTSDSKLFRSSSGDGRLPLFEGKMIHQFDHRFADPKYWVNESEGRQNLIGRREDTHQQLDYQEYRLGIRAVASNTNSNSLICSALPRNVFCGNSILSSQNLHGSNLIFCIALMNSFVIDWSIRNKVSQNINMFYIYQLPVPRLSEGDPAFFPIVERSAKLICTTEEFDDLAAEVGLGSHKNGVTDPIERQRLRAELDAIIAHLYGLTEEEFEYILTTFPLVSDSIKSDTLAAFRTFAPHPDDAQLLELIEGHENNYLEFKVAACWNSFKGKVDDSMRIKVTEGIAAFLNSRDGGTMLIGVDNDSNIVGLAEDFKVANRQKQNRDGYERFLTELIRDNCNLADVASLCEISFHNLKGKDICRIGVKPSPKPVYHQKGDFFVRDGGGKHKLPTAQAIEYIKAHYGHR